MKLTPPFGASDKNFSVYSTRKRKSDFLEKQCYDKPKSDGISEPFRGSQRDNSAYLLPRESNSQHNARTFSGRNVCGSALGMVSNQNLHFMDSSNEGSQLDNCQLYDLNNNISLSLQTSDGNNQGAVVGNLNNTLGNAQFLSFLHNGSSPSPLLKSPVPEIPLLPVMQLQAQDMVIRNDHNIQSYSCAHNAPVEKDHTHFSLKSHTSFSLKSGLIFEQRSHFLSGNSSQKLFSSPSDSLKSSQVLQYSMLKNQESGHYGNELRRSSIQDFRQVGSASEFKQNGQKSNDEGARDVSIAGIGSSQTSASSAGKEAYEYSPYPTSKVISASPDTFLGFNVNGKAEDQFCSVTSKMVMPEKPASCEKICLGNKKFSSEGQGSMNSVIKNTKRPYELNMENVDQYFEKKIPPDGNDCETKKLLQHDDDPSCSPNYDGKGAVHNEKVAPKIIKLWDGLLQLNASTTVSAVAFFKSGEKALQVNWSKLVEVKGKVKLEAFEKYIQELPRSRNRALMVVSLCWKVGSSKKGLTAMKEVAKGYSEGDKVGFAQPAPGIDIYICPRSDTIITILAKYGFFKGMAAVEDNKNSLIGCVVWRKNRTSSNSVSKSSEKMKFLMSEQQMDSASDSTISRPVEISSPLPNATEPEENGAVPLKTQSAGNSTPLVSDMRSPSVGESMSTQITDSQAGNNPDKVDDFHVIDVSPKLMTTPDNAPFASVALPTASKPYSKSLLQPLRSSLKSEIPSINVAEPKKIDPHMELLEPHQQRSASPVDDDLPEFDFSTACGLSQGPVSKLPLPSNKRLFLDAPEPNMQFGVEGIRNIGGATPQALTILRSMEAISGRQTSHATTLGGLPTDAHHGIPLPRKQAESNSQVSGLSIAREMPAPFGSGNPTTVKPENEVAAIQGTDSHIPHKNVWDDDDDMPEWCPPDLEQRIQPLAVETIGLSNLSHVPKPASENVPPVPPLPSNSMSLHPSLSQGFPRLNFGLVGQHPGIAAVMPQKTRPIAGFAQSGPSYPPRFNPNKPLRPQHPLFDVKLPIKPVDWRTRKH
eukprot:TRINITY_DN3948_c0_g1_i3.p1 TRINITY_DN3948_c0_g1~~TRINITY_DN3948_c0_g1_i3.p1  ORF type:complete len:1041 (-),score=220.72 TRINITY_DN3948_c0_g1_i3:669-3791(-)